MREFGAGGQVQKLDRLRQLQQRRRGGQEIVRQREDGADRAVRGLLVGIVVGRLLLCGFGGCPLRSKGRGDGEIGIRQADPYRLGGGPVKVPERQRKLNRERKQRQPRAMLEVFPEPVHDDVRLVPR